MLSKPAPTQAARCSRPHGPRVSFWIHTSSAKSPRRTRCLRAAGDRPASPRTSGRRSGAAARSPRRDGRTPAARGRGTRTRGRARARPAQHGHGLLGLLLHEGELHLGVAAGEERHRRRQRRSCGGEGTTCARGRRARPRRSIGLSRGQTGDHHLGVLDQRTPGVGERHPAAAAVDERRWLLLERRDLLRDRGLRRTGRPPQPRRSRAPRPPSEPSVA